MSHTFDTAVFSNPQGEAAARVYVVAAPRDDLPADELASHRLSGHFVGPTCQYSSTLQAKIPFKHHGLTPWGDRTALLAEATIPDPCYWSTETPFLYRAVGEIAGSRRGPMSIDRTFGIRSLGVHRKRIVLNDKPWVPRIIRRTMVGLQTPLAAWRESQSVASFYPPDRELCEEADRLGVLTAAMIDDRADAITVALQDLGRYAATTIVSVAPWEPLPDSIRTIAKNTLLAYLGNRDTVAKPPNWADVVCIDADDDDGGAEAANLSPLPVILTRMLLNEMPLAEARRACDQMQSEFARKCEVAGYWVYEEIE